MNYYIADTHFGHKNVIKYDARNGGFITFDSVNAHDEFIITNWNNRVTNQDNVYILGDFSWLYAQDTKEILKRLNGQKFLIKGNHDRWSKDGTCKKLMQGIFDYKQIQDGDKTLILSHYPIMMWAGQHRGAIHLYGHVHNSLEENDYQDYLSMLNEKIKERDGDRYNEAIAINVGCMMPYMAYIPRTLDEILECHC